MCSSLIITGLPYGITSAMPLIFSSRKVSYANQGTYRLIFDNKTKYSNAFDYYLEAKRIHLACLHLSFVFWPYSLKIIWAPIIDCFFYKKLGRRKSWLLPLLSLLGIFMIAISKYAQHTLDNLTGASGMLI